MTTPDRKSTRLNSSHTVISYAVFCLTKKRGRRRGIWTRAAALLRYCVPVQVLLFLLVMPRPPRAALFPYTTLFRSHRVSNERERSGDEQRVRDKRKRRVPDPILQHRFVVYCSPLPPNDHARSEEHTSELQSHSDLVCRLLLDKKKRTASRHLDSRCCTATLLCPGPGLAFFVSDAATTESCTLSLHDALPISSGVERAREKRRRAACTR